MRVVFVADERITCDGEPSVDLTTATRPQRVAEWASFQRRATPPPRATSARGRRTETGLTSSSEVCSPFYPQAR